MEDSTGSNPQSAGFTEKLKSWLSWSWTYICFIWFGMVLIMIYVLRSPLKLQETFTSASVFLNTLTPKFYVALTGTSSLISGLILIFEWWYFRKYGTSFIEQVSVSHLRPLLGGVESSATSGLFSSVNGDAEPRPSVSECKVWRNPLNLFRGAEYSRWAVKRFMKLECKCHGVSGSCAVRTCWLAMSDFRRTGDYLRKKYNTAIEVTMNQDGTGFTVADKDFKGSTKNELVYVENSPDYCLTDRTAGSLGTAGRVCDKSSRGPDSCEVMCCGRGYDTMRVQRVTKCECKFKWCCAVECQDCEDTVDVHTCKPHKRPDWLDLT
ncbi:unnamed protein product [Merluccius merluccius]